MRTILSILVFCAFFAVIFSASFLHVRSLSTLFCCLGIAACLAVLVQCAKERKEVRS